MIRMHEKRSTPLHQTLALSLYRKRSPESRSGKRRCAWETRRRRDKFANEDAFSVHLETHDLNEGDRADDHVPKLRDPSPCPMCMYSFYRFPRCPSRDLPAKYCASSYDDDDDDEKMRLPRTMALAPTSRSPYDGCSGCLELRAIKFTAGFYRRVADSP